MGSILNINIDEFQNIKKFDIDDNRFQEIELENEYNNEFEINIIEVKTNQRMLKFDNDDCN